MGTRSTMARIAGAICVCAGLTAAAPPAPEPAKPAAAVDVTTLLPQAAPNTDYAETINTALAAGKTLLLPNTGKPFVVGDTLRFAAAGAGLRAAPGVSIVITAGHPVFAVTAPHVTFDGILFDGSTLLGASKPGGSCSAPDFHWTGGGMHATGPVVLQAGCDNAVISKVTFDSGSSAALTVQAGGASVSDSRFERNVGYGIGAMAGAVNFAFRNNGSEANGLEAIDVSAEAHNGEISGNRITGAGDNCVVLIGNHVRVTGNVLRACLANGLLLAGDDDVVTGNTITDNGQVLNPAAKPLALGGVAKPVYRSPGYSAGPYVAVRIASGSGGHAQRNRVTDNTIGDDQARPTQDGVAIAGEAADNTIGPNTIGKFRTSDYLDQGPRYANKIVLR